MQEYTQLCQCKGEFLVLRFDKSTINRNLIHQHGNQSRIQHQPPSYTTQDRITDVTTDVLLCKIFQRAFTLLQHRLNARMKTHHGIRASSMQADA